MRRTSAAPGSNYGPRGIREVSCQFLTYNAMFDFDVADTLSPVDCGDCDIASATRRARSTRAQADLEEILARARCRSPSAASTP